MYAVRCGFSLALVLTAVSPLLGQESLVDYMSQRGADSSFSARKDLWRQVDPAEAYKGTAKQNIALLDALKRSDAAPQLSLMKARYNRGEDVVATVSHSAAVLVETDLGRFSTMTQPGGTIKLGTLSGVGSYSVRVIGKQLEQEGLLIVTAVPNQPNAFDANLFLTPRTHAGGTTPQVLEETPALVSGLKKYGKWINSERVTAAAKKAILPWASENVVNLGTTTVVCAVGAGLAPETGGTSLAPCYWSTAGHAIDLGAATLKQTVNDMGDLLTVDERKALINALVVSNTAVQLGVSLKAGQDSKKICRALDTGLGLADAAAGEIESESTRIIVRVFIQEGRKITAVLCISSRP